MFWCVLDSSHNLDKLNIFESSKSPDSIYAKHFRIPISLQQLLTELVETSGDGSKVFSIQKDATFRPVFPFKKENREEKLGKTFCLCLCNLSVFYTHSDF